MSPSTMRSTRKRGAPSPMTISDRSVTRRAKLAKSTTTRPSAVGAAAPGAAKVTRSPGVTARASVSARQAQLRALQVEQHAERPARALAARRARRRRAGGGRRGSPWEQFRRAQSRPGRDQPVEHPGRVGRRTERRHDLRPSLEHGASVPGIGAARSEVRGAPRRGAPAASAPAPPGSALRAPRQRSASTCSWDVMTAFAGTLRPSGSSSGSSAGPDHQRALADGHAVPDRGAEQHRVVGDGEVVADDERPVEDDVVVRVEPGRRCVMLVPRRAWKVTRSSIVGAVADRDRRALVRADRRAPPDRDVVAQAHVAGHARERLAPEALADRRRQPAVERRARRGAHADHRAVAVALVRADVLLGELAVDLEHLALELGLRLLLARQGVRPAPGVVTTWPTPTRRSRGMRTLRIVAPWRTKAPSEMTALETRARNPMNAKSPIREFTTSA